ncbi:MAG: kelch repeat-containing protein [candidate division WOR-3 bacterium]
MKRNVMLLALSLVIGMTLAAEPVANSDIGGARTVRLYYGVVGSNDYIEGTAGPDQAADAWAQHSTMPTVMMDNAAASNATHSYVVTGYDGSSGRYLYRHATGSTTWETMAQPPQEISNGGCAIIGDTLYYCSGYSYGSGGTVDTLWKYSISGNNWTSAPGPFSGTTYNWQPAIVACAGKLYYISGCNQPGATNPSNQTWCYTPGSGWSQKANMNQGAVFMAAWNYHDTIWVAGGNINNTETNRTEFYDPVADVWTVNPSVFPNLPYAVWGCASGCVAGAATGYVAGGVVAGVLIDSVAYFDHSSRTWSVVEGMPTRIYRSAGAGSADGKAIVYGGSTGGFTPTNICQFDQLSTGNANDVGVSQILIPGGIVTPGNYTPRAQIKNFGTAAQSNIPVYVWIDSAGTRVYDQNATYAGPLDPNATANVDMPTQWRAVGGTYNVTMFTDLSGDQNQANDTLRGTTQVMQYTVDWYQSDTIQPDRVSRTACVAYQGKVHVICGNCFTHTSHPYDQVYDTTANTWSQGLAHPGGGVHNHDAKRIGDVIWVGGGSYQSAYYDNLTKLDLGANTWTVATAMPQTQLLYYELGVYPDSGWVYCFGGAPAGGTPIANAYKYNPATNNWTAIANMPGPRRNPMATTVGDTIYVIGGMSASDYNSTTGTVWKYSVLGNTWTVAPPAESLPDALGWGKAVTYDDGTFGQRIYVVGGYRRGTIVNACWRYDVGSGIWSADRNLLITDRSHGMGIDGNYIWVAGGYNTVILPNMIKGIIYQTGVDEGGNTIGWQPVASSPTFVRGSGRVTFNVPQAGRVNLSVYNTSGQLIRTLVDGAMPAGSQTATWDRTDLRGSRVAGGTYFYRLSVDGRTVSAKAIVLD